MGARPNDFNVFGILASCTSSPYPVLTPGTHDLATMRTDWRQAAQVG